MDKNIDKSLRTSLQRTYISYQEWARNNDIFHKILKLPMEVWGFVYKSSFSNYFIIINKNISLEIQKEVFCHEVEHIIYDMPANPYIIGLDMQYSEMENKGKNTVLNFFAL